MIRDGGGKYKKDEIVQYIIKMKLEKFCSTKTIIDFICKEFNYKKAYAYVLIKQANDLILEMNKEMNINAMEIAIAELESQREIAKSSGNLKLVFNISTEIYKLKQLYIERIQHSGEINYKVKFPERKKEE